MEDANNQSPQPSSFALKQANENVIARLMATGLFASKQHLLQAALMSLFADMQKAFKQATAAQDRQKWREEAAKELTIPDTDPHAVPTEQSVDIWNATEKHHMLKDGSTHEVITEPNTNLQD